LLYTPANCTYQSAFVTGADPGACVIDPDFLYTEASLAGVSFSNQTQLGRALSYAMVRPRAHDPPQSPQEFLLCMKSCCPEGHRPVVQGQS
jgi:hypothetical protein